MRRAWLFVPIAVLAVIVLAASQWRAGPYFVSGFLEAEQIRVGSRVGGRVIEVLVEEGDAVRTGDALLRLDPYDLQALRAESASQLAAAQATLNKLRAGFRVEEIAQANAKRDRQAANLDRLIAGPRPLEVQVLEGRLDAARARLVRAEQEHVRVQRLYENQQAAAEEWDDVVQLLDQSRAEFAVARDELALAREGTRVEEITEGRAALAEAQAALDLLTAGYRAEDVAEAEARAAALRSGLDALDRRIDELVIRAPLDCVVEAVDLQPGDLTAPGAPVILLIDRSKLWVRAYVPENRLDLTVGQTVSVGVDAFGARRFAGRISFIARDAEFTPSNAQTPEERSKQVFRIKVVLEEGLDVLRPGMGADVYLEPRE